MGRSLNRCMLIGNLGKDPEINYLNDGKAVAKFSIATDESYKNSEGEKVDKVEWHNLVAWGKLAEIIGQYIHKGSKVFVEGKLQTRSWDDKDSGKKRYATEIVVANLVMLDGKPQGGGASEGPAAADTGAGDSDLPF